jgi:ABC-type transporter Mla subunit MlaD
MGLLGDKFIDITPGNRNSPIAPAEYLLKSQDPIDYEAILGRKDAGDFFVNIVESSASLKHVLRDIDQGNGVIAQLIHDKRQGQEANHVQQSIAHLDVATAELQQIIHRVNAGQGVAGAFTSDTPQSRQMTADLAASASKLRNATERLDRISQRFESGQGLLPRLIEDRQFADTMIADLQQSTHEAHSILYKIDTGQGTVGKLVNDPELYNQSRSLVGGGGMGFSVLRGLYNITHPFNRATAASSPDSDGSRDSSARSQAVNAQTGNGSGYYAPMPSQQTSYGSSASQRHNNNSQGYSPRQTQQGSPDGSRIR